MAAKRNKRTRHDDAGLAFLAERGQDRSSPVAPSSYSPHENLLKLGPFGRGYQPLPIPEIMSPYRSTNSDVFGRFQGEHYERGGRIQQRYGSGRDDEPINATPGEQIINRDSSNRYRGVLEGINSGEDVPVVLEDSGDLPKEIGDEFKEALDEVVTRNFEELGEKFEKSKPGAGQQLLGSGLNLAGGIAQEVFAQKLKDSSLKDMWAATKGFASNVTGFGAEGFKTAKETLGGAAANMWNWFTGGKGPSEATTPGTPPPVSPDIVNTNTVPRSWFGDQEIEDAEFTIRDESPGTALVHVPKKRTPDWMDEEDEYLANLEARRRASEKTGTALELASTGAAGKGPPPSPPSGGAGMGLLEGGGAAAGAGAGAGGMGVMGALGIAGAAVGAALLAKQVVDMALAPVQAFGTGLKEQTGKVLESLGMFARSFLEGGDRILSSMLGVGLTLMKAPGEVIKKTVESIPLIGSYLAPVVDAFNVLPNVIHKGMEAFIDLIERGINPAKQIANIVAPFATMVAKFNPGAVERFQFALDNLSAAAGRMFEPIILAATAFADDLNVLYTAISSEVGGAISAFVGPIKDAAVQVFSVLVGLVGDIATFVRPAFDQIGPAVRAVGVLFKELYGTGQEVVQGLSAAFGGLTSTFLGVSSATEFFTTVIGTASSIVQVFAATVIAVSQSIRQAFTDPASLLSPAQNFGNNYNAAMQSFQQGQSPQGPMTFAAQPARQIGIEEIGQQARAAAFSMGQNPIQETANNTLATANQLAKLVEIIQSMKGTTITAEQAQMLQNGVMNAGAGA